MCNDCTQALNDWSWPGYMPECPGCFVRAVAKCPEDIRHRLYARECELNGQAAQLSLERSVKAEELRIRLMKALTPIAA